MTCVLSQNSPIFISFQTFYFPYASCISPRIPPPLFPKSPSLFPNMWHRYQYLLKHICRLSSELHKSKIGLLKLQFFPLHFLWVLQNKDTRYKVTGTKFLRKILGPEKERQRRRINFRASDPVNFMFNRIDRETEIPALLYIWVTTTPSVKMLSKKKKSCPYVYVKTQHAKLLIYWGSVMFFLLL